MSKVKGTTCPKCIHMDNCDEDCRCCGACYMSKGIEVCNKICDCVQHEDDGGFFIDGNHPDDMFSLGDRK